jgi:hypothetical protein
MSDRCAVAEVAELVGAEDDDLVNPNVSAALAVPGMVFVGTRQAKAAIRHAATLADGASQLLAAEPRGRRPAASAAGTCSMSW